MEIIKTANKYEISDYLKSENVFNDLVNDIITNDSTELIKQANRLSVKQAQLGKSIGRIENQLGRDQVEILISSIFNQHMQIKGIQLMAITNRLLLEFRTITLHGICKAILNGFGGMYGTNYRLDAETACKWIQEYESGFENTIVTDYYQDKKEREDKPLINVDYKKYIERISKEKQIKEQTLSLAEKRDIQQVAFFEREKIRKQQEATDRKLKNK